MANFPGQISDWILHKDNQIVVFNKPNGLPIQPDRSGNADLLSLGAAYAHHDLYLVHRLDRPVSGVVVLGQKAGAQTELTHQFKAGTVGKQYLAVVGERPARDADTLVHFLKNDSGNRSAASDTEVTGARRAELDYRYLASSERYHLLAVTLKTGRKHQIRAQLAAIGCPVRGDRKYGFKRSNPGGSIDLHAYRLSFQHPGSGAPVSYVAPPPEGPVWRAFAEAIAALG